RSFPARGFCGDSVFVGQIHCGGGEGEAASALGGQADDLQVQAAFLPQKITVRHGGQVQPDQKVDAVVVQFVHRDRYTVRLDAWLLLQKFRQGAAQFGQFFGRRVVGQPQVELPQAAAALVAVLDIFRTDLGIFDGDGYVVGGAD